MSKLLGEFLQEKQEPFALEVYLLERGHFRRAILNSGSSFSTICANFSNRSASNGIKRRKYAVPSCSKFVKGVFTRLVSGERNYRSGDQNKISRCEEDKFSTATVSNSCSESDEHFSRAVTGQKGNLLSMKEVAADTKWKWRTVEENKQHSPVSVLEETETESEDGSPLDHKEYNNNGESSTSFSPCKVMKPTHYGVQQELIGSNSSSSQYTKNKRALQQTKQLLFDCVREVVENYRKNDRRGENLKKILGPEELWKSVYENVWLWSQDSISETNIIDLLHFDFLASTQEWVDYEKQENDISMEVGDAILDHVIDEIIVNFVS